jgi:ribosomal protein S18 acetylase RimI-like enzyme
MKFETRIATNTEDGRAQVELLKYSLDLDGEQAFIEWEPNGELFYIKVPEKNRRQGIATRLWNEAKEFQQTRNLPPLKHSEYRTKDGDAWAQSFGEQLPVRIPS